MSIVTINVNVDVDVDLSEIDDEDLTEELKKRNIIVGEAAEVEKIWLEFRDRDCPQCLSDFIYKTIGKIV